MLLAKAFGMDPEIKATALDEDENFLAVGSRDGRLVVIVLVEAPVMEPEWRAPDDICSLHFFKVANSLVVRTFRKHYLLPAAWVHPD